MKSKCIVEQLSRLSKMDSSSIRKWAPELVQEKRVLRFSKSEFLRLQKKYGSDSKIAEAIGFSSSVVSKIRRRLKIKIFKKRKLSKSEFFRLWKKYGSDAKIAKAINVSTSVVNKIRNRFEIESNVKKLDLSKTEFLKLQKEYGTDSAIAKRVNIAQPTISKKRRKFGIKRVPVVFSQSIRKKIARSLLRYWHS